MILEIPLSDLEDRSKELMALRGASFNHVDLMDACLRADSSDFFPDGASGFREHKDKNGSGLRISREVKHQMFLLICTEDERYSKTRSEIETILGKNTDSILAIISAAVGSQIGFAATVLMPVIVIALHGLLSVGKNTFCGLLSESCTETKESPNDTGKSFSTD